MIIPDHKILFLVPLKHQDEVQQIYDDIFEEYRKRMHIDAVYMSGLGQIELLFEPLEFGYYDALVVHRQTPIGFGTVPAPRERMEQISKIAESLEIIVQICENSEEFKRALENILSVMKFRKSVRRSLLKSLDEAAEEGLL